MSWRDRCYLDHQISTADNQSCETDGHSLPVSALMYACTLELIASDAISHFCNVINELRKRVSTLEKKL
jgi:hypothetical protein